MDGLGPNELFVRLIDSRCSLKSRWTWCFDEWKRKHKRSQQRQQKAIKSVNKVLSACNKKMEFPQPWCLKSLKAKRRLGRDYFLIPGAKLTYNYFNGKHSSSYDDERPNNFFRMNRQPVPLVATSCRLHKPRTPRFVDKFPQNSFPRVISLRAVRRWSEELPGKGYRIQDQASMQFVIRNMTFIKQKLKTKHQPVKSDSVSI